MMKLVFILIIYLKKDGVKKEQIVKLFIKIIQLNQRLTLGICITKNNYCDFTLTYDSLKSNKFINFINKIKINNKKN